MDRRQRTTILMESAVGDRDQGIGPISERPGSPVGITRVAVPGGGSTNLMRVMQTNACSLSCGYCPTFCGGKVKRTALSPEEIATTFMEAHRKGLADGLFLTSGVPGRAHRAVDRMLAAVDLLRRRERFEGYVHLKLLPGAEPAQVDEATVLANRVSVNLEAPADRYVRTLAAEKDLSGDLLPTLERAGRRMRDARRAATPVARRPAGVTTQFMVGAAGERDREILALVSRLERERLLHHAHFSAFQPVTGTPMEGLRPTPAARELRLYQCDHLLRHYGFTFEELVFDEHGNLPLDDDPKTAWALRHPQHFPLDVMTAPYELLLRVPGIGPATAQRLVRERLRVTPRCHADLRRLGIDVVRAGFFLALRGRRLDGRPAPRQLRMFAPGGHLTTGPWNTPVPPCAYR
jgi:predicted DNA-binding helix-hairpin-helix protein